MDERSIDFDYVNKHGNVRSRGLRPSFDRRSFFGKDGRDARIGDTAWVKTSGYDKDKWDLWELDAFYFDEAVSANNLKLIENHGYAVLGIERVVRFTNLLNQTVTDKDADLFKVCVKKV